MLKTVAHRSEGMGILPPEPRRWQGARQPTGVERTIFIAPASMLRLLDNNGIPGTFHLLWPDGGVVAVSAT
jgi:hypothetical protein